MKKFLTTFLAICFVVPCLFLMTACNGDETPGGETNYASQVAGKYANTYYESDKDGTETNSASKITASADIQSDGKFTITVQYYHGVNSEIETLKGTMVVNEDKSIKSLVLSGDLEDSLGTESFLGNILPQNSDSEESSVYEEQTKEVYLKMLGNTLKSSISFTDSYMTMYADGNTNVVLYKEGAQKLAEGTILRTMTEKDSYENLALMGYGSFPPYEYDYYFTKASAGEEFDASTINFAGCVIDAYGNAVSQLIKITEATGFDLSKLGTGTATLKYKNGTKDETRTVSYAVVEEENLPVKQITKYAVTTSETDISSTVDVVIIEKATGLTKLYDEDLYFIYKTYEDSLYYKEGTAVAINQTNCEGEDKVITITGFDGNKLGYQEISIAYRGKVYKQAVYVYDDTNDLVVSVSLSSASVSIKGTEMTVSGTLTPTTISGKTQTTVNLTKGMAINLKSDLSKYTTDDSIVFKYDVDGYSYYFSVKVSSVEPADGDLV